MPRREAWTRRSFLQSVFGAGAAVLLGEAPTQLGQGEGGARLRDRVRARVRTVRHKIRSRLRWYKITLKDGTVVEFSPDRARYDDDIDVTLYQPPPDMDWIPHSRHPAKFVRMGDPKPLILEGTVDGVEYYGEVVSVHESSEEHEWDADDPEGQRAMALYGGEHIEVEEWVDDLLHVDEF